jgi:hypothetical protein
MQDIMNSKTEHLLECVMPSCPTPVVRESFLLTRSLLLVLLASIVIATARWRRVLLVVVVVIVVDLIMISTIAKIRLS